MRHIFTALVTICLVASGSLLTSAHGRVAAQADTLPTLRFDGLVGTNGIHTLDPALVISFGNARVVDMIDANLVKVAPDGTVIPDLATWSVSSDRLTYTFTLRANTRFSDGTAVTAQDVVYSLLRALSPQVRSPAVLTYLGLISGAAAYHAGTAPADGVGIRALDARTVQIRLIRPAGYFLAQLSFPVGAIVRRDVIQQFGNDAFSCVHDVGAGPFMCASYGGQPPTLTLVPNPSYYGNKPQVTVVMPATTSTDQAYAAFLAGNLDVTPVPPEDLPSVQGNRGFYDFSNSTVYFLEPNLHAPPMDNPNCRRAVLHALDTAAIASSLSNPQKALNDLVPEGLPGYLDSPNYAPWIARRDMQLCGFEASTPLTIAFPDARAPTFALIKQMLERVGFPPVVLRPLTTNDWYNFVSHPLPNSVQLALFGWSEDYPDPQDYLQLLQSGFPYNIGHFSDPQYDRLTSLADAASDPHLRALLYMVAQHEALGTGAFMPLWQGRDHELVKPGVHGFVGSAALSGLAPKDNDWSNISLSGSP